VNLTTISLDDFLCKGAAQIVPASPAAFLGVEPHLPPLIGAKVRDVGQYALHKLNSDPGDMVLLLQGKPIGCYLGDLLAIDDNYQGQKLSVPLVLEAVKARPQPTKRKMSQAGEAALATAWRVANGKIADPWP
jgi:hypothetical protein